MSSLFSVIISFVLVFRETLRICFVYYVSVMHSINNWSFYVKLVWNLVGLLFLLTQQA